MLLRTPMMPLLVGAVSLLLGVLLSVLAVPRLVAALIAIPGDSVQFDFTRGRTVGDDRLTLMINNRVLTLRWFSDPVYYRDISAAAALLAFRRGLADPASVPLLQRAEEASKAALRLAPVDPVVWARLAYVRRQFGAPPAETAAELKMSLRAGRYDPALLEPRLQLALAVWPALDAEERTAYMDQIRILWRDDAEALARTSLRSTASAIIIQGLAQDREAIERLQAFRRQLRGN